MKCSIVKDLLSNYIDGLTSEETNTEIRKHLDNCDNCRTVYEEMSVVIPQEIPNEDKNIDFLKRLKAKMIHKNIMVALLTCIIVLCGLIIFAKNYQIPLPFDVNRMSVELCPSVVITNEKGRVIWEKLDTSKAVDVKQKDSGDIINVVERVYRGISQISESSTGREVNRNGENVRVIYYCYAKTLWTSLLFDSDLAAYSESGSSTGSDIYGDGYETVDYKPQMIEIYYLPVRNLNRLEKLSDEEFDMQKEKGTLVWKGVN
ncbi:MAG: hypothetical protein E7249_20885 [Paenibacillaceae bacterium]|nr:hypothetical protein [Paenibacillaceae bacterium]